MNRFNIYHIILLLIVLFSLSLRVYRLDSIPPSLYSDEINQAYNAYSILLTGNDEHGSFLPISLRSFGDWKPPLQSYIMIPFIYFFGLNEFSVRLPSAILGVLSILLTYFLVMKMFPTEKLRQYIALLSSFILSISAWHILQSRSAMLVIVSLFCLQAGILFFIKGLKSRLPFYISPVFFSLSVYAYYGMRLVTPLIIIFLFFHYHILSSQKMKHILGFVIILIAILIPLFHTFFKQSDVLFGRAKTVSVFYDRGVKLRQWELITQDGIEGNPIITRFFHNNVYLFGRDILQRYFSHFDLNYLLRQGDKAFPFQIPNMGIIYAADIIFLILGSYFLIKEKQAKIILIWLFVSILPAAFTFMTPSSNRTFNAIIPYSVLIAYGLIFFLKKIRLNLISQGLIIILYTVNFWLFMKNYFIVLPERYAQWWNYGWKEVVEYLNQNESRYDNIIISDTDGMPYTYILFYKKYNPLLFQENAARTYVADNYGFEHVESFDKYIFISDSDWNRLKTKLLPNSLYIVPAMQVEASEKSNHTVYYPDGKAAYEIFVTGGNNI